MAFTDYDKCALLLPMDGSNNGTTFTDWSPSPKTITRFGDAKTVTAQSKYYGSSGYFDGTGDYLSIANNSGFEFGAGDFTISFYFRLASISGDFTIVAQVDNTSISNSSFSVRYSSSNAGFRCALYSGGVPTVQNFTHTPTVNTWHHGAFTRAGNSIKFYADGSACPETLAFSQTVSASTTPLTIARLSTGSEFYLNGYLQDLLIIKGAALWTSNFTPPARLVGEISGNVKDINGNNASRIIHAIPRSNPTRIFSTTSDGATGNYTLRLPATEVSRIVLANEVDLYNDKIDRIIPE